MSGVEIVPASGGVFEVAVNGRMVFSKKASGRFPDEGEAEKLIAQAIAAPGA